MFTNTDNVKNKIAEVENIEKLEHLSLKKF